MNKLMKSAKMPKGGLKPAKAPAQSKPGKGYAKPMKDCGCGGHGRK